jgi:ATP-dependent Clp protease ATP-binding subunit ClpA
MLERFTKDARRVVTGATKVARDSTAGETRPEHLLRALLDDEDSTAVRVLEDAAGASAAALRDDLDRRRMRYVDGLDADDADALAALGIDLDEVVRRIDRNLGGSSSRRGAPRYSRAAKKVLELALREAIALRHDYIGTEHLLLGLVREGDRVVRDTLAAFDVETAELRRRVADAARKAG